MKRAKHRLRLAGGLLLLLACLLSLSDPLFGATNYVINTSNSGSGSLRQAILDANTAGGGTIRLSNVIGTIGLTAALPPITGNISFFGHGLNQ